jgi:hypothetical protein
MEITKQKTKELFEVIYTHSYLILTSAISSENGNIYNGQH